MRKTSIVTEYSGSRGLHVSVDLTLLTLNIDFCPNTNISVHVRPNTGVGDNLNRASHPWMKYEVLMYKIRSTFRTRNKQSGFPGEHTENNETICIRKWWFFQHQGGWPVVNQFRIIFLYCHYTCHWIPAGSLVPNSCASPFTKSLSKFLKNDLFFRQHPSLERNTSRFEARKGLTLKKLKQKRTFKTCPSVLVNLVQCPKTGDPHVTVGF